MTRFDPNHALPLFKVISPRSKMDSVPEEKETSQKHKKKNKKPEAQVHKIQKGGSKEDIKIRKTFSANFDGKVKHKNNEDSENEDKTEHKTRIKKKYLIKENDRLTINNIELTDQLVTVQNTIQKRESTILKLKEKLVSVQNFNKDILNENNIIKMQYEDILVEVEKFKTEKSKCINCDELKILIHKNSNEYELLQKQNKDLNEDINMLKNVVYRLNVQLERYQDKLRKNNITFPKTVDSDNENITNAEITNHSDHKHSPISWGNVNAHTLGPLLDAYQDTVKEKEDIISAYEIELSNFTGKLKSVIDENEILHKNILENSGLLKKTLEEYESVKTELKNTKEQNEVLIKKCALKHDKVHELCKVYDHKSKFYYFIQPSVLFYFCPFNIQNHYSSYYDAENTSFPLVYIFSHFVV